MKERAKVYRLTAQYKADRDFAEAISYRTIEEAQAAGKEFQQSGYDVRIFEFFEDELSAEALPK